MVQKALPIVQEEKKFFTYCSEHQGSINVTACNSVFYMFTRSGCYGACFLWKIVRRYPAYSPVFWCRKWVSFENRVFYPSTGNG